MRPPISSSSPTPGNGEKSYDLRTWFGALLIPIVAPPPSPHFPYLDRNFALIFSNDPSYGVLLQPKSVFPLWNWKGGIRIYNRWRKKRIFPRIPIQDESSIEMRIMRIECQEASAPKRKYLKI